MIKFKEKKNIVRDIDRNKSLYWASSISYNRLYLAYG